MRSTFARLCWLKTTLLAGSYSSCKKSDALLRVFRGKHLLRGSIVLSHCVLPPVHIGQDLVYSGITVFTIKPDKYKVRVVACGNKTSEIYGKISTTDLDAAMLRFLLLWGASSSSHAIASLDVTAAFLNAALPEGMVVVLRPPTILYKL